MYFSKNAEFYSLLMNRVEIDFSMLRLKVFLRVWGLSSQSPLIIMPKVSAMYLKTHNLLQTIKHEVNISYAKTNFITERVRKITSGRNSWYQTT